MFLSLVQLQDQYNDKHDFFFPRQQDVLGVSSGLEVTLRYRTCHSFFECLALAASSSISSLTASSNQIQTKFMNFFSFLIIFRRGPSFAFWQPTLPQKKSSSSFGSGEMKLFGFVVGSGEIPLEINNSFKKKFTLQVYRQQIYCVHIYDLYGLYSLYCLYGFYSM